MSLSVRDILILDFFDNKPLHTKIPAYKSDIYGDDAHDRLDFLINDGFIRQSVPRETLHMLPEKALSDFLSRYGSCEGLSKADLIRLIIQKIPENAYSHAVPKVYIVTQKGRSEIAHNMAYILNVRENYGLSNGEIRHWQNYLSSRKEPYNARTVLNRAMNDKASLLVLGGKWSKLRNLYYTLAHFHLRSKDDENALSYLLLVFFMDLSGMRDDNRLASYENIYPTQKGIILLIDELRMNLKISLYDMKTKFLSTVARMAPGLPFSYFSPQTSAFILTERLRGVEFSPMKYITDRNVPDPSAKAYKFEKADADFYRNLPFKNKKIQKLHIPVFVPPNLDENKKKSNVKKVRIEEKHHKKEKGLKEFIGKISSFFSK